MSAIARRLDATEGQVWSLAIGLVIAVALALAGLPPVMHHAREPGPVSASIARRFTQQPRRSFSPVTEPPSDVPVSGDASVSAPRSRSRTSSNSVPTPEPLLPAPFGTITRFAPAILLPTRSA